MIISKNAKNVGEISYDIDSGSVVVWDGTYGQWISKNSPSIHEDEQVLVYNIQDKKISFTGKEIIRLKEMLDEWTKEKHPEDLL